MPGQGLLNAPDRLRLAGFVLYAEGDMIFQSWRAFGGGDDVAAGAVSELLPGVTYLFCVEDHEPLRNAWLPPSP